MPNERDPHPDDPTREARTPDAVSRRSFIQAVGISSATAALGAQAQAQTKPQTNTGPEILGPGPINVSLTINNKRTRATIDPDTTLLDLLRLNLKLTGAKEICARGSCGGCSVLLNGTLVASCLTLAADAQDANVTTIEGLAHNDTLDPIQESFIRHDALQCGYCTPGCIMASRALLNENPKPTLPEIKQGLSGNFCRCAAYVNIYNAVLDASGQPPIRDGKDA